jgi:hypothetical protein
VAQTNLPDIKAVVVWRFRVAALGIQLVMM